MSVSFGHTALSVYESPTLTTTFTPPTTCLLPTFTLKPQGNDVLEPLDFVDPTVDRGIAAQCYPPGFWLATTTWRLGNDGVNTTLLPYYSPGLICPVGYTTASVDFQGAGETTSYGATCCPSDLSLYSTVCVATIGDSSAVVMNGSQTVQQPEGGFWPQATPIILSYQNADLSSLPTSSTPTPGSTATQSLVPPTTSARVTKSAAASLISRPPSSLSSGAKAGIGVGAAIVAIAALTALFFVLRWKKRKSITSDPREFSKPELDGESLMKPEPYIDEVGDTGVSEVNGMGRPAEMDQNVRAELEGGWRGHEAPAG